MLGSWHSIQTRSTLSRDLSKPRSRAASANARRQDEESFAPPNISPGQFSEECCQSPTSSVASNDASMIDHKENYTPPESPGGSVPGVPIGRLSLDHVESPPVSPPCRSSRPTRGRGRGILSAVSTTASKRSASSELPRRPGRLSPGAQRPAPLAGARTPQPRSTRGKPLRQTPAQNLLRSSHYPSAINDFDTKHVTQHPENSRAHTKDSGYFTSQSRQSTMQEDTPSIEVASVPQRVQRQTHIIQVSGKQRYPGLILQPDTSPISQEQLQAEVKGIYHGLLMVEAKCINIDTAQAADPESKLGPEQYQALIALHRTLLYEHHDFLMATQHPSASPMLRGLATKYSMPARMWKHGIHAFLEVLRHRRPESQDYMMAFIYLAYQMVALLLETVPTFLDTWIECLGDLARYRMAIEEEKEAHAQWGAVAARWYTMSADRYPQIGRLNHHLGILERPSLRKFFFYAKSLNCVLPFPNARDSLQTLCTPIIQDERTIQNSSQSAEARIVTFHALEFTQKPYENTPGVAQSALELLVQLSPSKVRDIGVSLAVTNVAAMFGLGNVSNPLWQLYSNVYQQSVQLSRPSIIAEPTTNANATCLDQQRSTDILSFTAADLGGRKEFAYNCANILLSRKYEDEAALRDVLPFVHVFLIFLHSLLSIQSRLPEKDVDAIHTLAILIGAESFFWEGLALFLNCLVRCEDIPTRVVECAKARIFLVPDRKQRSFKKPLTEDYMVRGLVWTQFYFADGWFDGTVDEDGRSIDHGGEMTRARIERVLWLGLIFACHTEHLQFDAKMRQFSAPISGPPRVTPVATTPPAIETNGGLQNTTRSSASPSALSPTSEVSVEDGFTVVSHSKTKKNKKSSGKGHIYAVGKHGKQDLRDVRVAGEDVEMESDGIRIR